ncbi:methyltransferase domain-containing protein [Candidatus Saccharibacteria bacterium]|nr:methyltransferase domain-containing protein [Candidatus Saccharibacteria bacterium]
MSDIDKKNTKGVVYADRLNTLSGAKWKQILDVQRPYRWNLSRLNLGRTLDVGCGIGRNLGNLSKDSVGVDHNPYSIKKAKELGYNAVTTKEFTKNKKLYSKESFDSMLLAHVLEHLSTEDGKQIIKEYLPYVKDKVVIICPQEKGFTTDETHINFLTHNDIEGMLESCGLMVTKSYSFPFFKSVGKIFAYNETVVVAEKLKKT